MSEKLLSTTNLHLQDAKQALRNRVRSLASSTAIETGESVTKLEARIKHLRSQHSHVTLA